MRKRSRQVTRLDAMAIGIVLHEYPSQSPWRHR